MKTMTLIFAVATLFASCSNSTTDSQTKEQAFKEMRDSLQLDSFRRADAQKLSLVQEQVVAASPKRLSGSSSSERSYVKGVSETYTNTEPKKKGWSKAAKGAAIGAGAGAVTGIIVDKKDGRGAVVGGLVGAGTGYVIGRSADKRDGR